MRELRIAWLLKIYLLPILHLCACLVSFSGLVIPSLQHLVIRFTFILVADLRISAPAYALGWKCGTLAAVWVFVTGTLSRYLLARGAHFLIDALRRRKTVALFPSHRGHDSRLTRLTGSDVPCAGNYFSESRRRTTSESECPRIMPILPPSKDQ
jgi:hypothetical protein